MNAIAIDPALVRKVRRFGKFDVGACLNCGGCTVDCTLSTGLAAFPRKTMRYVHFGLASALGASLDPWLCHFCGSCSDICPREAEPAESMMTLRRYLISRYDFTGIAERLYTSSARRIAANAIVALLVVALVLYYHLKIVGLGLSDLVSTPMGMEHMFGIITYFTIALFVIPAVLLISGAAAMHRATMGAEGRKVPLSAYAAEFGTMIVHGFTQRRLAEEGDRNAWIRHLSLFAGFTVMSVIVLFFLRWFQTDKLYPIWNPQRWLGYLATAALLYGSVGAIVGRANGRERMHRHSDIGDWTLPILILAVALSGIAVHVLRYAGLELPAHFSFLIHMIFVAPLLLIELPFGKLSHMVYRPLAIWFQAAKERAYGPQAYGPRDAGEGTTNG